MSLTSRSSYSVSYTTSDGDVTVQETQDATVAAERPDAVSGDETMVTVMGDAIAVGEDTLAYATGSSTVDGDAFYATVDLLAISEAEDGGAYTSTGAMILYSSSADAVFSIQTSRTVYISDADSSLSASATSSTVIGIDWAGDVPASQTDYGTSDLVSLIDTDPCSYSIEGNIAFVAGDATAYGDATFTDLSLYAFTVEDTLSSASIQIITVA